MPNPKPLYALTNKELVALEQDYPRGNHPTYGLDLRAEIERREREKKQALHISRHRSGRISGTRIDDRGNRELGHDLSRAPQMKAICSGKNGII